MLCTGRKAGVKTLAARLQPV